MARQLLSRHRLLRDMRDWLTLSWALWWSWAYVQGGARLTGFRTSCGGYGADGEAGSRLEFAASLSHPF